MQHRVVVGDVQLTRANAVGAQRTICAVRRRPGRSPAQVARLCEDMAAASQFLRRERRRRRLEFRDNVAVQDNLVAAAHAEVAWG